MLDGRSSSRQPKPLQKAADLNAFQKRLASNQYGWYFGSVLAIFN